MFFRAAIGLVFCLVVYFFIDWLVSVSRAKKIAKQGPWQVVGLDLGCVVCLRLESKINFTVIELCLSRRDYHEHIEFKKPIKLGDILELKVTYDLYDEIGTFGDPDNYLVVKC